MGAKKVLCVAEMEGAPRSATGVHVSTTHGSRSVVLMGCVVARHQIPIVNPSTGESLGYRIQKGGVFEVWCERPYDPTLIRLTSVLGSGLRGEPVLTTEEHLREHFEMVLDPKLTEH